MGSLQQELNTSFVGVLYGCISIHMSLCVSVFVCVYGIHTYIYMCILHAHEVLHLCVENCPYLFGECFNAIVVKELKAS